MIPVDISKQPKSPPYKNHIGRWYGHHLFYETSRNLTQEDRHIEPKFSLYSDDIEGCISCRKTFVELNDPSGYKWAIRFLGSYDHWKYLMRSHWFRTAVESWVEELTVKIKTEAFDKIRSIASQSDGEPPAAVLTAAKYLASEAWKKGASGRGRPSSEEIRGELKRATEILSQESNDAERIGLQVINGDKI